MIAAILKWMQQPVSDVKLVSIRLLTQQIWLANVISHNPHINTCTTIFVWQYLYGCSRSFLALAASPHRSNTADVFGSLPALPTPVSDVKLPSSDSAAHARSSHSQPRLADVISHNPHIKICATACTRSLAKSEHAQLLMQPPQPPYYSSVSASSLLHLFAVCVGCILVWGHYRYLYEVSDEVSSIYKSS